MKSYDYKPEWYGGKGKLTDRSGCCTVIEYACEGSGRITSYEVFPGISLMFIEFDTPETFEEELQLEENILELRYCLQGRVEFFFRNGKVSHLQQGQLCVNRIDELGAAFSFPFSACVQISLLIDREAITDSTLRYLGELGIRPLELGADLMKDRKWYICHAGEKMAAVYQELWEARGNEADDYFRIRTLELLYLGQKLRQEQRIEARYYSKEHVEVVKRIRQRMVADLGEKIPLEKLAEEEGISLVTFQAIFKQIYNATPYAYLKHYKMDWAARRLADGSQKINEIAIAAGYQNASKFSRAFRTVYGVLPKDYRKQQQT